MKRKNLLIISALSLSAVATACSTTTAPAGTNANSNVAVLQSNSNPIANAAPAASPATNSAVPGIPNAPANANMAKGDPTKNAKVQNITNPAPDNSEVTVSLGQFPVETRTFKNNAELAKVERIQDVANKKTIVKVYLRNGQVKELPPNVVGNPMAASAAEILQAAQNAQPAKPEPKVENPPAPQSEQRLEKRGAPQKNQ
ncbi:MAG TPA: hypothetical protein VGB02_12000 [Pyrinomonadaceae bacterium]|jgi:predicted small secreted protein